MTFVILILILGGLALMISGIEDQSIASYIQGWINVKQ